MRSKKSPNPPGDHRRGHRQAARTLVPGRSPHRPKEQRMARPVCKRFFQERLIDQSATTYPASETCSQPRWRYARFGPHKIIGVLRRVLFQDSQPPFDCHCQAILCPPLADLFDHPRQRLGRSILTLPRATLLLRIPSRTARPPRRFGQAYWRAPRPRHWYGLCRQGS